MATETDLSGATVEDGVPDEVIAGVFGLRELRGESRFGGGLATGEGCGGLGGRVDWIAATAGAGLGGIGRSGGRCLRSEVRCRIRRNWGDGFGRLKQGFARGWRWNFVALRVIAAATQAPALTRPCAKLRGHACGVTISALPRYVVRYEQRLSGGWGWNFVSFIQVLQGYRQTHVHKQGFVSGGHFLLTLGAGDFNFHERHFVGSAPVLGDQLGDKLVVEDGDDVFRVGLEEVQLHFAVNLRRGPAAFAVVFHR